MLQGDDNEENLSGCITSFTSSYYEKAYLQKSTFENILVFLDIYSYTIKYRHINRIRINANLTIVIFCVLEFLLLLDCSLACSKDDLLDLLEHYYPLKETRIVAAKFFLDISNNLVASMWQVSFLFDLVPHCKSSEEQQQKTLSLQNYI